MKNTRKTITAFILSLAFIASNAGNILPDNISLTARASTVYSFEVQGKDESYYDAETQTLHLKGYVRNGADGSGLVLPDGVKGEEVVNLIADEGTVFPANCSHFFEPFGYKLWEVDLTNADTSNVTDMSYMFYCPKKNNGSLYFNFDISTFNTSKVTNMEGMFLDCTGIYSHKEGNDNVDNFANFDTSNVTNMSKMFKGAADGGWHPYEYDNVENDKLTFESFNTSKVTDMSEMFAYANFPALNLTNFDTSNVTTMSRMFEGNWHLIELDISTFNTSNVTDMSYMFNEAYVWAQGAGLEHVDLSSFNTSNVTDMSYMFANTCLSSLDLSSFDTSNVTDMSNMFLGSEHLSSLDVSSFDTHNVKDMSGMFCRVGLFELDVRHFIISDDTNIEGMFIHSTRHGHEMSLTLPYGWTIEEMQEKDFNIFWSSFNEYYISEVLNESYFDAETRTLHIKGELMNKIDGSGISLPKGVKKDQISNIIAEEGTVFPQDCSYFFAGFDSLWVVDLKNADTSNVTDMSYMFMREEYGNPCQTNIDLSNFNTQNVTNMKGMFKFSTYDVLDLSSFDTSNVTDMSEMFEECVWTRSIDVSSFDTSNVIDMTRMFSACRDLETLDLSNFNTSKVKNMHSMFCFTFFDYLDLSCLDTSSVTDMSWMFGDSHIKEVNFTNFNTSNVTDMDAMFIGNNDIEVLDLSSFDTSNVTNMSCMFAGCSSLKTIYVSNKWSTQSLEINNGTNHNQNIFEGCYNLTGGKGTVYDDEHIDLEYAHIDDGKNNPGYLTAVKTNTEANNTIVIDIPEETMDLVSDLYNSITDPALKGIFSAVKNFLNKFMSFKII